MTQRGHQLAWGYIITVKAFQESYLKLQGIGKYLIRIQRSFSLCLIERVMISFLIIQENIQLCGRAETINQQEKIAKGWPGAPIHMQYCGENELAERWWLKVLRMDSIALSNQVNLKLCRVRQKF